MCAPVTLSVNSPTSQYLGKQHMDFYGFFQLKSHIFSTQILTDFFTVDSLKDADLRDDVPFGGLDDE